MKHHYHFISTLFFLGVIFLFASCRTAGLYTSNPKDKMAFAGTQFELTKKDSFFLSSWTDSHSRFMDKEGNEIFSEKYQFRGSGTYQCEGDSLELIFCNEDSITIKLDFEKRLTETEVTFQIFDELGNVSRPNVDILDSDNKIIRGTNIQFRDVYHFVIPNQEDINKIKIAGFGMRIENPIIDISSLEDGKYIFKRKSYNGYFAKGVIKKIWYKKVPSGIRYQMRFKKKYLPRKWKWNWINKLYRDY